MFNRQKKNNAEKNKRIKFLGIFILIINVIAGVLFLFKPKKLKKFLKGEKAEIEQLSKGEESCGKFLTDSWQLTKNVFVPHEGNDHKPKALRPKSLITYVLIVILAKVSITGFLFLTYPDPAQLAAIVADRMVNLVNTARIEAEVEPLTINDNLIQAATVKGQDMLAQQYFSHDTPEGKRPWQWINRGEYDYVYAGENLAMDFTSAEVVQSAFMKSPTHRKNILNPNYKEIGIAVLHGEMNGQPTILLVEFFGTQRKDKDTSTVATTKPVETNTSPEPTIVPPSPSAEIAGVQTSETTPPANPESFSPEALPEGIIIVTTEHQTSRALIDWLIEYSNIFFIAFLVFITISLVLNIAIKFKVQHSSVIVQTMAVAALIIAMILVKFHFVEQIAPQILIL